MAAVYFLLRKTLTPLAIRAFSLQKNFALL